MSTSHVMIGVFEFAQTKPQHECAINVTQAKCKLCVFMRRTFWWSWNLNKPKHTNKNTEISVTFITKARMEDSVYNKEQISVATFS